MQTDNQRELKPCPFCGGWARMLNRSIGIRGRSGYDWWHSIQCAKCNAAVGYDDNRYRNKADAIAAWNTRASAPAVGAPREVVERFCQDLCQHFGNLKKAERDGGGELWYGELEEIVKAALASRAAVPSDEVVEAIDYLAIAAPPSNETMKAIRTLRATMPVEAAKPDHSEDILEMVAKAKAEGRKEGIREALAICELIEESWNEYEKDDGGYGNGFASTGASSCADSLRKLLEPVTK